MKAQDLNQRLPNYTSFLLASSLSTAGVTLLLLPVSMASDVDETKTNLTLIERLTNKLSDLQRSHERLVKMLGDQEAARMQDAMMTGPSHDDFVDAHHSSPLSMLALLALLMFVCIVLCKFSDWFRDDLKRANQDEDPLNAPETGFMGESGALFNYHRKSLVPSLAQAIQHSELIESRAQRKHVFSLLPWNGAESPAAAAVKSISISGSIDSIVSLSSKGSVTTSTAFSPPDALANALAGTSSSGSMYGCDGVNTSIFLPRVDAAQLVRSVSYQPATTTKTISEEVAAANATPKPTDFPCNTKLSGGGGGKTPTAVEANCITHNGGLKARSVSVGTSATPLPPVKAHRHAIRPGPIQTGVNGPPDDRIELLSSAAEADSPGTPNHRVTFATSVM